ncbi:MAG: hypothetical protein QM779_11525 [Propionicimonas sp.]|uniref:hypothetical protein n=1 Tax=Propionicimonas sp. TaxID=1955623 RepID=UPI003D10ADAA
MATTIADLTAQLDQTAAALAATPTDPDPNAHAAGWMLLADRASRAVEQLSLGGQSVGIGLRPYLESLVDGPDRPLPGHTTPAAPLARMSLTMGAIADVLADNLRNRPRPEYVGREAAKLAATLAAPLHLAARWSHTGLQDRDLASAHRVLRGRLDNLAAATEPWALIPPARRDSVLADLRIRTPTAPGLDGAIAAWADEALLVLGDRHRTSSWAMQAIAGNLALISHAAYNLAEHAIRHGALPETASQALATSATAWRAAATWPPYLRLGGRTNDLRTLSAELKTRLATEPPTTIADTRHLLHLALPVAEAHATTMDRLARSHDLWIHGPSLGPSAGDIPNWEPEPWWSFQGIALAKTAQIAHQALDKACVSLAVTPDRATPRSLPLGWPPACEPPTNGHREGEARGRDVAISREPAR